MELNFKTLEEYLQGYLDGSADFTGSNTGDSKSLESDLDNVSPAQRLGFIEKYLEFIEPKQLRRGTSTASSDKDFTLNEAKE